MEGLFTMDKNLINKFKARGKDEGGVIHIGWLSAYFVNGKLKTYIQEAQVDKKPAMTYFVKPESVEHFVCLADDGTEIFDNGV